MPVPEKLKSLVDRMPEADSRGMYTQDINKQEIEKAAAEIAKGGPAFVQGLVEMLGEPGTEENVKPHYALHCVINHPLVAGDDNMRRQFCEVLAKSLDGDVSTYNKAYLCQELQWAGGREAVSALGKLLTDAALCDPAAMALAAIGDGAADELRKAWPQAEGPCRLAVADALAALADSRSADVFREALEDDDREVRLAGGAGLSRIADAGAVDAMLGAADVEPGWERVQQTKHCLVLAENLAAAGKDREAGQIYSHLQKTRKDPSERYIREAAEAALANV